MTDRPVRRSGRSVDEAARTVTWAVAEGARGRRWRWTLLNGQGRLVASHTVELDPGGRFTRLESAAGTGLLTLHREADGSLHGNRVMDRGVEHVTVAAPAPTAFLVGEGAPGVAVLAANLRAAQAEPGTRSVIEILEVFDDLGLRVVDAHVSVVSSRWDVRTDLGTRRADLDADGLPRLPDDVRPVDWALEREA